MYNYLASFAVLSEDTQRIIEDQEVCRDDKGGSNGQCKPLLVVKLLLWCLAGGNRTIVHQVRVTVLLRTLLRGTRLQFLRKIQLLRYVLCFICFNFVYLLLITDCGEVLLCSQLNLQTGFRHHFFWT